MILLNETLESKNSLKLLDSIELNKKGISEQDRLDLIGQALLDERLSGIDTKLYMFLLNFENKGYRQEDLANILSLTRVSVNKSISKLLAFNYISTQKGRRTVTEYTITPLGNAGVSSFDIDSIKSLYQLESKTSEYFGKDNFDIEEEWNSFKYIKLTTVSNIDTQIAKSLFNNNTYKFLLFTATCNDFRVIKFKEKYLESFIRFYNKFVSTFNKEFYEAYYYLKKEDLISIKDCREQGYYIEDIMRLFDIPNSSDKAIVNKFKDNLISKIDDFIKAYNYALDKDIDTPEELKVLLNRLKDRLNHTKQFTLEEMLLIAYIGGYKYKVQEKLSVVFEKFVMIINEDLLKEMNVFSDMLNKYRNRF